MDEEERKELTMMQSILTSDMSVEQRVGSDDSLIAFESSSSNDGSIEAHFNFSIHG